MHLRFPWTTLIFHSQDCWANWTLPPPVQAARTCTLACVLGQLLSTSKMAPAGQESKKRDLKWIFPFAAPSTLAAVPAPSPSPPTWYAHASPSQLALL